MIPGEINIQTLFAQLRLEQMLAYLPAGGWYGAEEGNPDRIRFQRVNGDNGNAPFVLLLPRTSTAPQSRRLLQAAVYTLCDVEDRQPAEIIQDILAVEVAATCCKTFRWQSGRVSPASLQRLFDSFGFAGGRAARRLPVNARRGHRVRQPAS